MECIGKCVQFDLIDGNNFDWKPQHVIQGLNYSNIMILTGSAMSASSRLSTEIQQEWYQYSWSCFWIVGAASWLNWLWTSSLKVTSFNGNLLTLCFHDCFLTGSAMILYRCADSAEVVDFYSKWCQVAADCWIITWIYDEYNHDYTALCQ